MNVDIYPARKRADWHPRGKSAHIGIRYPTNAVAAHYCSVRNCQVFYLLIRMERQIRYDISRLRSMGREAQSSQTAQARFRRLIAKREEMLESVRGQLCSFLDSGLKKETSRPWLEGL